MKHQHTVTVSSSRATFICLLHSSYLRAKLSHRRTSCRLNGRQFSILPNSNLRSSLCERRTTWMGIAMYFLSLLMSLERKSKASTGLSEVAYTTKMSMSRGFSEYRAEPKRNSRLAASLVPRCLTWPVILFLVFPDLLEVQGTHELSEHKQTDLVFRGMHLRVPGVPVPVGHCHNAIYIRAA